MGANSGHVLKLPTINQSGDVKIEEYGQSQKHMPNWYMSRTGSTLGHYTKKLINLNQAFQ